MKQVFDKIIKEKIQIQRCSPGDEIYIFSGSSQTHPQYGHFTLIKIKPIGNDLVQIKCQGKGWRGKPGIVQKINLRKTVIVERTRKAVRSDHEVTIHQKTYPTKEIVIGVDCSSSPDVSMTNILR